MKLSKKDEADVLKAYKTYFESYASGDIETIAALLDDNYTQIGSAEAEVFFDKKEALKFLHDTIDQVAGKAELRNRTFKTERLQGYVLIIELFDMYVLMEGEWAFYSKLRASTLMEKIKTGWKFVYQHSSMPDVRAVDGDNIAIEKISAENQQLREAVKRRTVEIEAKNRELEIEAALERVRARTMAMHQSSELAEAGGIIFEQLRELRINAETSFISLVDSVNNSIEIWTAHGSVLADPIKVKAGDHPNHKAEIEAWKSGQRLIEIPMPKKKFLDPIREKFNVHVADRKDRSLFFLTQIRHQFGFIGMGTWQKLTDEELSILTRFTKVFEQTYTRFLDLQKAEEQAREAQIEVALERVRNKAMSMTSSAELANLVITVFQELQSLDMVLTRCLLWIFNPEDQSAKVWMTNSEDPDNADSYQIPNHNHPAYKRFLKGWKAQEQKWEYHLKGKNKASWDEILVYGYFKSLPAKVKKAMTAPSQIVLSGSFNKYGVIQTAGLESLSSQNRDILQRFSQVFEQTYSRYRDLQKAEEQVREAQVEAALERVRARSMAMHKTDELKDVINIVSEQYDLLNINLDTCFINIFEEGNRDMNIWIAADGQTYPEQVRVPYIKTPAITRQTEARERGESFFTQDLNQKFKDQFFNHFFKNATNITVPKKRRDLISKGAGFTGSVTVSHHASITIANYHGVPYTDEENEIFKRIGAVFEQTYTRFLDLQKAEAQAREAQIEVALERIRAASLAMHESNELLNVIKVISNQLEKLAIQFNHVSFGQNNSLEDYKFWTSIRGLEEPFMVHIPYINHPMIERLKKARKDKVSLFTDSLTIKQHSRWNEHMFKHQAFSMLSNEQKEKLVNLPFDRSIAILPNIFLVIANYSGKPYSDKENKIISRVGKVFEQAYTRFLDLQKAEAQAREAQIEAALERVRSKTMAMHNSHDVGLTVVTLFDEVIKLGLDKSIRCGIGILEGTEGMETWSATSSRNGKVDLKMGMLDMTIHPMLVGLKKAWKSGEAGYSYQYIGNDVTRYYNALNNEPEYPIFVALDTLPDKEFHNSFFFSEGILFAFTSNPISKEGINVLNRFASVFGQTYTRYLDLQKAEEQAREGQIEAALERIRAKALAMHASDELMDVARVMREQMGSLGQSELVGSVVHLYPENSESFNSAYSFIPDHKRSKVVTGTAQFKKNATSLIRKWLKMYHSDDDEYTIKAGGLELKEWIKERNREIPFFSKHKVGKQPSVVFYHFSDFSGGSLAMSSNEEPSHEAKDLQRRAALVFDLAYRRFLDLQKAEEQTREALIEGALEKVRSRSLAMHESHELSEVAMLLNKELRKLGFPKMFEAGYMQFEGEKEFQRGWLSDFKGNNMEPFALPLKGDGVLNERYNSWKKQKPLLYQQVGGKKLHDHIQFCMPTLESKQVQEQVVKNFSDPTHFYHGFFKQGALCVIAQEPLDIQQQSLLTRFTKAFQQTYTRFIDLQKAETQAREAQIEAALERVRARSMAMHKTDELKQVIEVISEQFKILEITHDVCLINIFGDETNKDWNFWIATYPDQVNVPYFRHPIFTQLASARQKDVVFYTQDLNRKDKDRFFDHFYKNAEGVKVVQKRRNFISKAPGWTFSVTLSKFASIHLANYRSKSYTDEENQILRRIGNAFEQTYTRFLDLKKAEAREMEAIKQSSLDRVRAEIASMRTADDLNRITPLVWQELTTLGVPFFRCGVFIMDIKAELAHAYLSTPSGSSLTALELKFDSMPLVEGAYKYWQQQEVYIEEWDKKEFIKWTKPLVEQGQFDNRKKYQNLEDAPNHLVLQLVPFKQGMLYVGSAKKLANDQIELVKSIADAFSVAYARYEDFKQLEEAKGRIENTLGELKSTQTQLVHAEKMASLGELTAGIAHEIQNPLNFVNNFSEVSGELVEEIKEELKAGNLEDVDDITTDLKQNLEKINHHGQRASGIVKGMLEHSRTGSSEKELTDINKLADEYLRLSYHGLRAKDKSFNSDFKTDLDESLPKVMVITQDLGRVILNLINNAFYAVSEKSKADDTDYKPVVVVSTKKLKAAVEITVQDNGHGIPKEIVDKIFQPFFTTKPTGSGTGLGLSMSYDIITKGHGGELKVNTVEEEGTEFIITLPY